MIDPDRLRAAADRLVKPGDLDRCNDPYECCIHAGWQGYPDPSNLPADPEDVATAALLRAVADNHDNGTDRLSTTVVAAEELADVILGSES